MTQVSLRGLSKTYGDAQILKNINLEIDQGEFLTLVGPSGCGKSTLLRIIAGLEAQSAGSIALDEKVVDKVRPSQRNLAMVFQSYALYPHLSVQDNIAVPLRMRDLNHWQRMPLLRHFIPGTKQQSAIIREKVYSIADTLGLVEHLEKKPGALSGGQRQRVAVGRAMVREPLAFLFDEPLSNLDAKLRVHMRTEISQLHRRLKSTFIYVTHDQAEAMTMSDRIAVMMQGEVVQVGNPDDVYFQPVDTRVAEFIGSPKINLFPAVFNEDNNTACLGENKAGHQANNRRVLLGVRPENLQPCQTDEADLIAEITFVENMGSELFLQFATASIGENYVVRLAHDYRHKVNVGEQLALKITVDNTLVFDADGKRCYQQLSALVGSDD